jgi:hypothetical protein
VEVNDSSVTATELPMTLPEAQACIYVVDSSPRSRPAGLRVRFQSDDRVHSPLQRTEMLGGAPVEAQGPQPTPGHLRAFRAVGAMLTAAQRADPSLATFWATAPAMQALAQGEADGARRLLGVPVGICNDAVNSIWAASFPQDAGPFAVSVRAFSKCSACSHQQETEGRTPVLRVAKADLGAVLPVGTPPPCSACGGVDAEERTEVKAGRQGGSSVAGPFRDGTSRVVRSTVSDGMAPASSNAKLHVPCPVKAGNVQRRSGCRI